MRIYFISLSLIFLSNLSYTQVIRVFDRTNLQPIENVAIFNTTHSKTALTNNKGEAIINNFNSRDTLIFQHPSYKKLIISFDNVKKLNFHIKLTERLINLREIIVSANKWEQKKKEVPNKITVISSKEVSFDNPQTSADLLGASNEIFIQKSQLGGGSPMIRGFAANSVLLVIDGVRMNNAIYRSGNLQNVISIDPNIIENAEVIFGPGSVIYGSDALGGVMDFHTQKIRLAYNDKNILKTKAFSRYSSANQEKTFHLDINYGRKKWGSLTSFTYSNYSDLRMGSINNPEYKRNEFVSEINGNDTIVKNDNGNIQKYSAYNQRNFMQKIRFKPNKYYDITYAFHYSNTSDIPRYDRLIQYKKGHLKYAEWYYGPQKWIMNALNIKLLDTTKFYDQTKITLAYQDIQESRNDRKYKDNELRIRTEDVDVFTANFDFDKKFNKKNTLFYGLEAVYNKVDSKGLKKNIKTNEFTKTASRYPDAGNDYVTSAAYLDFKSNINKKLTLVSGARYSYVYLKSNFKDTTFYHFPYDKITINTAAVNGCIGLVFRPTDKLQLNINTSSGFRAPNLDDVAKVFDSEPGNVVVPNTHIKPEYAYNIDVGIIKNTKDKIKISITGFYTFLKDAMVRRNFTFNGQDSIYYDGELSKIEAIVNTGKADIYGGNISLYGDITNCISFRSNLTYTYGKDENKIPLRHIAPLFGNTAIMLTADKIKAEIYANYNGEITNDNLAPSEKNKPFMYATDVNGNPYSPSWWTLNLKTSYQLNKYIQFNIGVENLLDNRYRPYSSGICAPGRNFIFAVRGKF